jgi:hypothetical protein
MGRVGRRPLGLPGVFVSLKKTSISQALWLLYLLGHTSWRYVVVWSVLDVLMSQRSRVKFSEAA